MRTRIKICGLTRIEDAVFAAKVGVDAIGLVFYPPSPRCLTLASALQIVSQLPAFTSTVGLFVNQQAEIIEETLDHLAIDTLQFHGEETPAFCRQFSKPYIKSIAMQEDTDLKKAAESYHDASALLLDVFDATAKGGTGRSFDWNLIRQRIEIPIILAGGLSCSNVSLAINKVKPYALDVSSGVESAKGIKDQQKIVTFLQQVYECDGNE
ncbi:MAG: phosphoribosylanthranilate isomerase [Methylococcaceae bacterium]